MMFCPKCGSLLKPKNEKGKSILACSCGYSLKPKEEVSVKEEMKGKEQSIEIVSDNDKTLPVTDAECSKCKNKKAYFWLIQTRAGDEPETKFLKCTSCKHTWRDYN